jgi:hypothetical protein
MDGWKVEKQSNNKLCFTKKNIKKHFTIESFMKKHIPLLPITNIKDI